MTATSFGPGIGSGPAASARPEIDQGYLQPPDDTTAVYSFTGSGAETVAVSWSPVTTLSLIVDCPKGTQEAQGSSSVSITIPNATGQCQVTLHEPAGETSAVSYAVTIGASDG